MALIDDVIVLLKAKDVDTTKFDNEVLDMRINGLFESVVDYTKNDFIKNGELHIPYDVKDYIANMIKYEERADVQNNLKSRTMGTVSYTFNDTDSSTFLEPLKKYRKARFYPI